MSRFYIGNQTAFSAPSVEVFRFALDNKFEAFEWFPDKKADNTGWETSDIAPEDRERIKALAKERGMRLSVHVPWYTNPLLQEHHGTISDCIKFGAEIEAKVLVLHLYAEAGLEQYAESIMNFQEPLLSAGMTLAIENTVYTCPEEFNTLFAILSGQSGIGMCFDAGHANLCSSTLNDYIGFLESLGQHVPIRHVHLHENFGDRDSHLTLFTGPSKADSSGIYKMLSNLDQRGYEGSLILEQWPQPPEALLIARTRLIELIKERTAK